MIPLKATIWLSFLGYSATMLWLVGERTRRVRWPRIAWSLGCLLLLLHIAAAFAFVHRWSHAAAVADTARQTERLLGVSFGGGVWFNYAFALVWFADAAWWWVAPKKRSQRPAWIAWIIHGYLFFIWINGAVVFAGGKVRWLAAAAFFAIAAFAAASLWRRRGIQPRGETSLP